MLKKVINETVRRFRGPSAQRTKTDRRAKARNRIVLPKGQSAPDWGPPSPLPHAEPPVTPYPSNCLSPGLREVAEAIAAKTQAPIAIAAQSVLSVVSLTFASRAKVQTLGSNANAACFFVLVAMSGERKSATDRWAMGGVERTVLEIRQEHARLVEEYEQFIKALDRDEPKPPRPICPNFLVTEPTVEGAFKAISSGAGFLGWFSDEAATFFGGHSMSQDKMALTCGIISKFWDGAFFIRPRATQEGTATSRPHRRR